jgi:phenylacetate-CoA ligase
MAEIVAAAGECEHGRLHLWPEVGLVEVLDPDSDGVGELICTGLLNADMPLIRYRVGDRGRLVGGSSGCPCGRALPALGPIEGRAFDYLVCPHDGHRIWQSLNQIAIGAVREVQLIQENLHSVRVRYVPANDAVQAAGEVLASRLRERLGPVEVILEPVEQIPRGPNGKFRAVISKVAQEAAHGR